MKTLIRIYVVELVMVSGTRKPETQDENPTSLVPESINSDELGSPKPEGKPQLFWYPNLENSTRT